MFFNIMRPLFTLPLPGVVANALSKAGYKFWEDLLDENGGGTESVRNILMNFRYSWNDIKNLTIPPVVRSCGLLQKEHLNKYIPTFSEELDNILGGGIRTRTLFEICGPPGVGKTQLVMQLCVNVQIPVSLGGLEGEAVFIDTDSGFSVSRLREIAKGAVDHCKKIAESFGLNDGLTQNFCESQILDLVHYIQIDSHVELLSALHLLNDFIPKHPKVKILVIDSLVFPLLCLVNLLERTKIVHLIIQHLYKLAMVFGLAAKQVVFTNHLTTNLSGNNKFLSPSLGASLSHAVQHILFLGRKDNIFSAAVHKSSIYPETVAQFAIYNEGLRDVDCGSDPTT